MNFNLNKKVMIIIGIGIFLVCLGILGMSTIQKIDEKKRIESQLTLYESRLQGIKLDSLSSQPEDLVSQMNQLLPKLEQAKAALSQPVSSTNATALIYEVAGAHGLIVSEITSSGTSNEIVAGVTLSAVPMITKVVGNASKIVAFVTDLNSRLKTSLIKSIELNVPEKTNGDNTTANLNLVIYSYRGE